jgi:hypothetical protein
LATLPSVANADHRRCYGGYRGSYFGGYGGYGGVRVYGGYGYGDPYHRYSSPGRIHYGPHGGYHVGPYYDSWGYRRYGPHGGRHYDLHGSYGHFYGL